MAWPTRDCRDWGHYSFTNSQSPSRDIKVFSVILNPESLGNTAQDACHSFSPWGPIRESVNKVHPLPCLDGLPLHNCRWTSHCEDPKVSFHRCQQKEKKVIFLFFSFVVCPNLFQVYSHVYQSKCMMSVWYSQMAVLCIYFYIYLAEKHI